MIKCPECGADNGEKAQFCSLCGAAIYKFCPECGHKNVNSARFCENCGTSLETSKSGIIEETQNNMNNGINNSNKVIPLDLTPAESLMITDHSFYQGHGAALKELLKVTLIDLIFKSVFKVETKEVEKKGIFGSKIVNETYLLEGKNFNMSLKPHEEIFRQYLPSKIDSNRLKKLQQDVYRHSNGYAKKKLLEPLALNGFFDVEKKFLGKKYSLSRKGIDAREMIFKFKEEGENLEYWIEKDPEKARAYLLTGGSNVFLTDDYYFDWFKNNSKKISKLFAVVAAVGTAYVFSKAYSFSNIRWYSAFGHHSGHIDFDDFDDFDTFGNGFSDIFSDIDTFDSFDSIDFSDFDSGFDSGGFDGGFDGGGDCGGGGD
ncbi:zinc ribbon domain-containing protein [Methanobacterium sp.]|uniref:zinc ribbon domain-containing protein n=1 Tax=Methanobacterium sp. TaxID=2164 RepID=UPI003C73D0B4